MNLISLIGRVGVSARGGGYATPLYRVRAALDGVARSLGRPPLRAITPGGTRFRGYLRHRGFMRHLPAGAYERVTTALFERLLAPDVAFIDGGAHIGYYTMFAADRAGRVEAFEPDPYNFAALRYNHAHALDPAARARVAIHPLALAGEAGETVFYVSDTTIGNSLARRSDIGALREVRVRATTLDQVLAAVTEPRCVIKIDVEGAEARVLDGGRAALAARGELVVVAESNPSALAAAGTTPQALVDQLAGLGLQVYYLDEQAGRMVEASGAILGRKGNLVALRGASWGDLRREQLAREG